MSIMDTKTHTVAAQVRSYGTLRGENEAKAIAERAFGPGAEVHLFYGDMLLSEVVAVRKDGAWQPCDRVL